MKSKSTPPEEITVCAYLIWEQEGRPEGRAMEHWLQAEAQWIAAHPHGRRTKPARQRRGKVAGEASDPTGTKRKATKKP